MKELLTADQRCEYRIWAKYDSYACPKPAKYYYVERGKAVHVCGTHRRVMERVHEMHVMTPDTRTPPP